MREVLLSQSEIFKIEKERLSQLTKDARINPDLRNLVKDCLTI